MHVACSEVKFEGIVDDRGGALLESVDIVLYHRSVYGAEYFLGS